MSEENMRKILRMNSQHKKELNEAFGLFLPEPVKYPMTEETAQIEKGLYQGTISAGHLKTLLRALGVEPRRDELK